MATLPPPTINVTINTTDSTEAQNLAIEKLSQTYPESNFTLISSSVNNNSWIGLYSIKNNTEEKVKTSISHTIVLFTINDTNFDNPENPYKKNEYNIIPIRADAEDIKLLPIKSIGDNLQLNSNFTYKYRTNAFAFWNKKQKTLVMSLNGNIVTCNIDNNLDETLSMTDIKNCINEESLN